MVWPHLGSHNALTVVAPLALAIAVPFLFRLTSRNKLDRWIGDLSYPVYLVHLVLMHVLQEAGVDVTPLNVLAVTLPTAVLLLLVVDHPAERIRRARIDARLRPVTGAQLPVEPVFIDVRAEAVKP